MRIPVTELELIFKKYPDKDFKVKNLETIFLLKKTGGGAGKQEFIKMDEYINSDNIHILHNKQIKEAFVQYTPDLHNTLIAEFPQKYRHYAARLPFHTIFSLCKAYHFINKNSGRKRHLICCEDILNPPTRFQTSENRLLLEYDTALDAKKLLSVKHMFDSNEKISVRFSECGIIIFVDMRAGDGFLERFYKNSDLVTSLIGQRQDPERIIISPDIHLLYDIITVDDPGKLLTIYKQTHSRLIIIGEVPDDEYKTALMQVKDFDPYARFLVATNIDQANINDFLTQVRAAYRQDHFDVNTYSDRLMT